MTVLRKACIISFPMKSLHLAMSHSPESSLPVSLEADVRTLTKKWPSTEVCKTLHAFYHFFSHHQQLLKNDLSPMMQEWHEEHAHRYWRMAFAACERHHPEGGFLISRMAEQDRNPDPEFLRQLCLCWNHAESEHWRRGPDGVLDPLIHAIADRVRSYFEDSSRYTKR